MRSIPTMRRHEALAELSRDHHQALSCALLLRRADDETAKAAAAAFLAFWQHGSGHFRIEEEVLLPALARHVDPRHQTVVRVLTDHVEIRRDADRLGRGDSEPVFLNELGHRLEAHVRHEERTLFPMAEQRLAEPELVELARAFRFAESEGGDRGFGATDE